MEEEGVGLALARATELRLKISNCITKATAGNSVSPYKQSPQEQEEKQIDKNGSLNGDSVLNSHQSLSEADDDEEEETTERLLDIREALESLESQLLALQNLQHQQSYEKEVALAEIDYSRRVVLEKLEDYQGKDMEVILEASSFFSKTVENNSDLLLPPYPSRPPRSLDNGSLSHIQSTYKSFPNGVSTDDLTDEAQNLKQHNRQDEPKNSRKGFGYLISSAVKTVLPIIGVMYLLSLSALGKGNPVKTFGTSLQRAIEDKNSTVPCPPGKVLVMEGGEARCLVKERIEVPFESIVAKPGENLTHKEMFEEVHTHEHIMSENENLPFQSGEPESSRNSIGNPPKECTDAWGTAKLIDSSIYRSHSSLSQRSAYSVNSPQQNVAKAVELYHSLPLSMLEQSQMDASNGFSSAEHLGTNINDHANETPNWLSEEMIKSISDIYFELADPPLINHDYLSSPISHFDNPFSIGEPKDLSGPYCTMVKVQWICRDGNKLHDIEHKLQYFRSLVYQLEEVDVRRMKHEEKLAFWINVHNSLVMHAYLVYGIPKNNLKRLSLLLKASYDVGGQTISIDTIQSSILGCRLPRPGQWLRFLFPSKTKFKVGDPRRAYAIESPEPLLHFALCSGSYSDPAVRIYTPKKVFQELEVAKEEYIKANWSVNKEQKILLPKLMEYFAKDSSVCSAGVLHMVEQFMPDSLRKNLQATCKRKTGKNIEWISHNFAFRYLFPKDLDQMQEMVL